MCTPGWLNMLLYSVYYNASFCIHLFLFQFMLFLFQFMYMQASQCQYNSHVLYNRNIQLLVYSQLVSFGSLINSDLHVAGIMGSR